jgi:molybdopterin converting factor small subunit
MIFTKFLIVLLLTQLINGRLEEQQVEESGEGEEEKNNGLKNGSTIVKLINNLPKPMPPPTQEEYDRYRKVYNETNDDENSLETKQINGDNILDVIKQLPKPLPPPREEYNKIRKQSKQRPIKRGKCNCKHGETCPWCRFCNARKRFQQN